MSRRCGPGHNPLWRIEARGQNGRGLCRWCLAEVPPKRSTWCGQECVDAYKAMNDWQRIMRIVRDRDCAGREVCAFNAGHAGPYEYDHVKPIADGGAFWADNVRILCRQCHLAVTREWRRTRADAGRLRKQVARPLASTPTPSDDSTHG